MIRGNLSLRFQRRQAIATSTPPEPVEGRWQRVKLAVNGVFLVLLLGSIVPVIILGQQDRTSIAGKVHLRFMYWGGPEQLDQEYEVRDAFLAQMRREGRTDIEVEMIGASSRYDTKLKAMVSAEEAPDVFMVSPGSICKFADRESPLIVDITDRVAAERKKEQSLPADQRQLDLDDFLPQAVQTFYCNGRLWGFPRDYKSAGVGYNADMLAAAGLCDPNDLYARDEWTWEKLQEYLVRLNAMPKTDGHPAFAWFQDSFIEGYWGNILLQAGGGVWSDDARELIIDRPESIAGLQFVYDLAWKDKLAKPWSPELGAADPWVSREVAMLGIRGWHVPSYIRRTYDVTTGKFLFAWDVAPWPLGPQQNYDPQPAVDGQGKTTGWRLASGRVVVPEAVVWQGPDKQPGKGPFRLRQAGATGIGYVMSPTTRHDAEAWRLLKFLVSPEAQRIRASFKFQTRPRTKADPKGGEVLMAGINMPSRRSVEKYYLDMAKPTALRPIFTGCMAHKNTQEYWPRVDVFLEARNYGRPAIASLVNDEIQRNLDRQFQRMLLDPAITPREVAEKTRARADIIYDRLRKSFPSSFNTPALVRPREQDPLGLAP